MFQFFLLMKPAQNTLKSHTSWKFFHDFKDTVLFSLTSALVAIPSPAPSQALTLISQELVLNPLLSQDISSVTYTESHLYHQWCVDSLHLYAKYQHELSVLPSRLLISLQLYCYIQACYDLSLGLWKRLIPSSFPSAYFSSQLIHLPKWYHLKHKTNHIVTLLKIRILP